MADLEPAVGVFEDLHLDVSVAGVLRARQQLQGAPLIADRVVSRHFASLLEAEDFLQGPL